MNIFPRMLRDRRFVAVLLVVAAVLAAAAATSGGVEVYVNGVRATGLKSGDMNHCSVKFDADGNVQILSPGYRVEVDKEGNPAQISGQSDFGAPAKRRAAGTLEHRYVLLYEPNPKVPFTFELYLNGKQFKEIGLTTSAFTIDATLALKAGENAIRVVATPSGAAPAGGTDVDVVKLRILSGDERGDGTFVAKTPAVWELVRSAVDREPIDRQQIIVLE
jgi:hypothetical protein